MGYAFSALLAPLRIADSRVPKPWRKADRGRTGVCAQYPEPPDASRPMQRVAITISGRRWTSLAEEVARAEFALVNAHPVLLAVGRERTRAYYFLVLTSGLAWRCCSYCWRMLDPSGALRPSGTASAEARVWLRTGLAKAGVTSSATARGWNQAEVFI